MSYAVSVVKGDIPIVKKSDKHLIPTIIAALAANWRNQLRDQDADRIAQNTASFMIKNKITEVPHGCADFSRALVPYLSSKGKGMSFGRSRRRVSQRHISRRKSKRVSRKRVSRKPKKSR